MILKHLPLHTDKIKTRILATCSLKLHLSYVPKPDTGISPLSQYLNGKTLNFGLSAIIFYYKSILSEEYC